MTIDTILWGIVATAGVLFFGSVAALVHIASVCTMISCLN